MSKSAASRYTSLIIAFYVICALLLGYGGHRFYKATLARSAFIDENPIRGNAILARDGINVETFSKEALGLYITGLMYHPYRWYSIPEDFQGAYFNTDHYGFRLNGERDAHAAHTQVGFFGGSTAFSVKTDDQHTIPALLEAMFSTRDVAFKNYGVGAYSLSVELPTFLEVVRRAPMKFAVFYDGVNEMARYVEYIQEAPAAPYFDTVGYPCYTFINPAIHNLPGLSMKKKPMDFARRTSDIPPYKSKSVDKLITADNAGMHAEQVLKIYMETVRDIAALAQGRGVVPIFFWQPDIWSTKKDFTAQEKIIRDANPGFTLLAQAVHAKVAQLHLRPEMKGILFFDISNALTGLDAQEHFHDFCHIDNAGNALVAQAVAKHFAGILGNSPHAKQ